VFVGRKRFQIQFVYSISIKGELSAAGAPDKRPPRTGMRKIRVKESESWGDSAVQAFVVKSGGLNECFFLVFPFQLNDDGNEMIWPAGESRERERERERERGMGFNFGH